MRSPHGVVAALAAALAFIAGGCATSQGTGVGVLDKDEIQIVIRAGRPKLRSCYAGALVATPTAQGKVVVRFVINPDGKVGAADVVEDTTGSNSLGICVKAQVLGLSFPQPRGSGPVVVTYPFLFNPKEE